MCAIAHAGIQRGEQGLRVQPGKSQVAICFLRYTGTERNQEAVGPLGFNCFLRVVLTALCKIR